MVRPTLEPNVPGWMQRYALSADRTYQPLSPIQPTLLWNVKFADLPPATAWPGSLVWVSDKNKVGFSNGTTWTDPAGGAL